MVPGWSERESRIQHAVRQDWLTPRRRQGLAPMHRVARFCALRHMARAVVSCAARWGGRLAARPAGSAGGRSVIHQLASISRCRSSGGVS